MPFVSAGIYQDLRVGQPNTFGFGWANRALMDGNLLIATNFCYKDWQNARALARRLSEPVGLRHRHAIHSRLEQITGSAILTTPIRSTTTLGQISTASLIGQANVQLFQAGSTPLVNQHRLTFGFGKTGFLIPNLDLDTFAGVMFKGVDSFGADTTASLALYYIGTGLTWRFGNCSPRPTRTATTRVFERLVVRLVQVHVTMNGLLSDIDDIPWVKLLAVYHMADGVPAALHSPRNFNVRNRSFCGYRIS